MENDLTGNEKYFELGGGSSYRRTFFFNHLADTFAWLQEKTITFKTSCMKWITILRLVLQFFDARPQCGNHP